MRKRTLTRNVSSSPEDKEEVALTKSDLVKQVPAARCRACGRVTWRISIASGLSRVKDPGHHEGCPRPPGRLDLLAKIPLMKRDTVLDGRLLRPMTDDEVAEAAKELGWQSPD